MATQKEKTKDKKKPTAKKVSVSDTKKKDATKNTKKNETKKSADKKPPAKKADTEKIASAYLKNFHYSPRKTRWVLDEIRGKKVAEAERILKFSKKKISDVILKVVRSAKSNATQKGMNTDTLVVARAYADGKFVLKRYMPRAFGRASRIRKRYTSISIILSEQ
jgi:large subunit ribosomal protein L22